VDGVVGLGVGVCGDGGGDCRKAGCVDEGGVSGGFSDTDVEDVLGSVLS
jgi:hypothetical protein